MTYPRNVSKDFNLLDLALSWVWKKNKKNLYWTIPEHTILLVKKSSSSGQFLDEESNESELEVLNNIKAQNGKNKKKGRKKENKNWKGKDITFYLWWHLLFSLSSHVLVVRNKIKLVGINRSLIK